MDKDQVDVKNLNLKDIHTNVKEFVAQLIPKSELMSDFNGNFVYLIPTEGFNASFVYTQITKNQKRLHIADWGLSQTTLEDVFKSIVENDCSS